MQNTALSSILRNRPSSKKIFLPVTQEHAMGCAVACVASRCGISYQKALSLFTHKEHAWTRGYYCREVVDAFAKMDLMYGFEEYDSKRNASPLIKKTGTVVFVGVNKKYPAGHYLLRTQNGWMNPWSNFPQMSDAQSEVCRMLPGKATYLLYELS
jgi:hypothetical protein